MNNKSFDDSIVRLMSTTRVCHFGKTSLILLGELTLPRTPKEKVIALVLCFSEVSLFGDKKRDSIR
jgi:hypothetical protein